MYNDELFSEALYGWNVSFRSFGNLNKKLHLTTK